MRKIINDNASERTRLEFRRRGLHEYVDYYNYIKVNPGITYSQFLDEDALVKNAILVIESLINEKNK